MTDVIDLLPLIETEAASMRKERIEKHGVEAVLFNTTPALVGSWRGGALADPERGLVEPPRPTDIAGKTRWWLRAILAAGTWETLGKHLAISQLDELASRLMGSAAEHGEASKLVTRTEPLHPPRVMTWSLTASRAVKCDLGPVSLREQLLEKAKNSLDQVLEVCREMGVKEPRLCHEAALLSARVAFTLQGREDPLEIAEQLPLPPGFYRFRLAAYPRPGAGLDPVEERLLGLALGMALFFTGIGRGVTRGYGKLAPEEGADGIKGESELAETMHWVYRTLVERGEHALEKIAEEAAETAREYIEKLVAEEPHRLQRLINRHTWCIDLPLAYTLHPEFIVTRTVPLHQVVLPQLSGSRIACNSDPWCVVAAINEAVKKTTIKNLILGKSHHGTGIGIPSYVLGLPRKDTYRIEGKLPRLLSMIHFTPIYYESKNRNNINGKLLIVGFTSELLCISRFWSIDGREITYGCPTDLKTRISCELALKSVATAPRRRVEVTGHSLPYRKLIEVLHELCLSDYGGDYSDDSPIGDSCREYRFLFDHKYDKGLCVNLGETIKILELLLTS